jgi:predicted nucleotidyltransferase
MDVHATVRGATEGFRGHALGAMLFGSCALGNAHERSDIDLCVVAGPGGDVRALEALALRTMGEATLRNLDVHIFEALPLYLQGAVIDADRVVWSEDEVALYAYLYPFRRRWNGEKHRGAVPIEDLQAAMARRRG